ncbi:GHKL domain-containing protein [Poseidonibacter lekithochrous]|uniref:ATP-binding protein n=1 Tax=Poseidonibacter TaxID=2321187 RepID=UPI001C09B627|nr:MULTISPECIES: ATP-binding protein [Poseidonibacter]MBU3015988.1 GHKL domain-containing protein [Poseidonibacter lekithochrous]MDO6829287.1 ATP-binding protein [Poseidonibacter sp. 1_MG-2023]
MTIRKRLYISFSLIILIVAFIIGVFFYTIFNLNTINYQQNHRYDQLIRVEKLKEFNNSYSWIVLDIITDFQKIDIVNERINKANNFFKNLNTQKLTIINNSESKEEKDNLILIFKHFDIMQELIKKELYSLVLNQNSDFKSFNKDFERINIDTEKLLISETKYLQDKLTQTQNKRDDFLSTIKLELLILFSILLLLSFIISSKIINEIKEKLYRLNQGVLQLFKNGEKTIKVDIGENNELSEITKNLNAYLQKQSDIIDSREELLRNISHELKTPIAKGKFLIEKLQKNDDHKTIKNINTIFYDIEMLTSKLLEREKLNFAILKTSKFKSSTLILESLSKLLIEDEAKVIVKIQNDFDIQADFYYLTIALKNLIDNAMKYAKEFPITIESKDDIVFVSNISSKLSNDLIYYIQPFTREPNQQQGHGLGLNIVDKILSRHGFKLNYKYNNSYNTFYISFK